MITNVKRVNPTTLVITNDSNKHTLQLVNETVKLDGFCFQVNDVTQKTTADNFLSWLCDNSENLEKYILDFDNNSFVLDILNPDWKEVNRVAKSNETGNVLCQILLEAAKENEEDFHVALDQEEKRIREELETIIREVNPAFAF